jgi:hypothetical protein
MPDVALRLADGARERGLPAGQLHRTLKRVERDVGVHAACLTKNSVVMRVESNIRGAICFVSFPVPSAESPMFLGGLGLTNRLVMQVLTASVKEF